MEDISSTFYKKSNKNILHGQYYPEIWLKLSEAEYMPSSLKLVEYILTKLIEASRVYRSDSFE